HKIDPPLLDIARVPTTYHENSYISKWNQHLLQHNNQPIMFKQVLKRSLEIHRMTDGAFDITVSPLMKYWFENDWKAAVVDSSV
ncbi:MAG: FAD:protein FMN transferase, partial [Flavobacteriales bacterium]|nr:FAD:protein FMN transferase [Flavobacteriales bacterium]